METILTVEHLVREYGSRGSVTRAIDDVSFSVEKGEFVGIMGASGSGKSTLLNCVSTIDAPTAGRIFVEGREITGLKPREVSRRTASCWTPSPPLRTSPWPSPSGGPLPAWWRKR